MTAYMLTREAPPWDRDPWFLELYASLLDAAATARPAIAARLENSDGSDAIEAGLALFLAGTYADTTGDGGLLRAAAAARLIERVADALRRELQPGSNAQRDTWVVALWAGALRLANHVLRRPDLTALIAPVKNHVYTRYVRGGTLMSSSDRSTLGVDVLLAAVPFGLFDAEDLVVVDAARRLTERSDATPAERQMLAWYFGEQGSYARSRELLAGASPLSSVVRKRLGRLGQLDARFIRHLPEGHGNRYEPLLEERSPKLVTQEDEVIVCAIAAPLSESEPLECLCDDATIVGVFRETHWEFALPQAPAGTRPTYSFRFRDHPAVATQNFSYDVLARKHGGALSVSGGRVTIVPGAATDLEPLRLAGITFSDVSWLEAADGTVREISLKLRHPPAGIYGLGERYNALNQAGNRVDQFVYNQYKNQGLRTYIPMPVFYTDKGFGLHIDTDSYSWFDFREPGITMLGIEGSELALDIFTGSVNDQIAQFIAATGEPEPVPLWTLGPWMSSNNWDSEAEVRKQVALTEEHGIPATVLVIEAWSDEATFYIFNDAAYAEQPGSEAFRYGDFSFPEWGRWPDPKGLVDHLHGHGLKLILWQIPVIKQTANLRHAQKRRDAEHFLAEGFGVRHPDGTALRLPEGWFKDSLLMDFTNANGVDWWFGKRQYLIDELGVDGFKTDGGEMVWGRDLVFADGTDGLLNRNRYPRDYISAYYDFAQQNDGICFSRAGYTGAQSFPAHWAGDERSTWDAFKRSLLAGLSAGMSGIIFWGWDLGGFSGDVPGAELFIRSAQMACFCPIMQYHAESKAELNQDRTPWNIADRSGDPRALTIYAYYANLRMQLLPYFEQEAAHCVAHRTPLMRAMLLDHQDDATAMPIWDQYQLGRDLLVAPVIAEGAASREVYLPAGRWWHLLQSRWLEGGRVHTVAAPLAEVPVFLRAGALLPLGFDGAVQLGTGMQSGVRAPEHLVLLFAVAASRSAEYRGIRVDCHAGGEIEVTGEPDGRCTLVFTDAASRVTVNGVARPVTTVGLAGVPLPAIVLRA